MSVLHSRNGFGSHCGVQEDGTRNNFPVRKDEKATESFGADIVEKPLDMSAAPVEANGETW